MSDIGSEKLLEIYLNEYNKLKEETISRISFRDNLLYVNLTAIGAIVSYAIANSTHYYALLVVPWICFILGWTYIVNDEKISAIGKYLRYDLNNKLVELLEQTDKTILAWETFHRDDEKRVGRKVVQFMVDELTFCVSGLIAIGAFWMLVPQISPSLKLFSFGEALLILLLGVEIFLYSDFKKGK